MTLLNELNVGGQQYGMMGVVPMGTCATPAGTAIKESAFADDFELSAGNLISVTFTYANTYGDGSTTYPSLKIGSYTYPIKYPTGAYAASGAWANGQAVTFMFDGTNLIMTHPVATEVQAGNNLPVSSAAVASALASYDKFEFILTDATDKIYKLGTTINASNYQAFTNIYMRGGRVDNVFGEGFITLYGTQYVWSRLLANLGGPIEIIVALENGQMTVYAKIPSYSTLLFNVAASSNFTVDIQEVSQISGTVIWNNAWDTVATFGSLGTMRSDGASIEKRIYIENSFSIGTVYYHHTGQDSYAFNYRIVNNTVESIGWLNASNTDASIAVSYNSAGGYLSVYATSNNIAQVVVTGTALIRIE